MRFGIGTCERALAAAATVSFCAMTLNCAVAQTQASISAAPLQRTAQLPGTVDRYGVVFDAWVQKHQPKTAILVVRRDGKTVFLKGHNADPDKPTMVASLSKPITGACVATLIKDQKLSFTTR